MKFKALIVQEPEKPEKIFIREISTKSIDELSDGDVLIKVRYSSLNYKDALSAMGNKGVTRKYPHTPGIDAAGIVEDSSNSSYKAGDDVIVTGYDLGMNTSGGFAEYIKVPAQWVVPKPDGLSLRESMILGTAGFTAGLSVHALEQNNLEQNGEIVVTGSTGGVGSIALSLLSNLGYNVVASTRKTEEENYLTMLGAKYVLNSNELNDQTGKPLLNRRWKGAVETVGGNILSTIIRSLDYKCSVASCGNALSSELNITVFPFILRGVNLLGINSAETPMNLRKTIWQKLAGVWKINNLEKIVTEVPLEGLNDKIDLILKGKIVGRVLVRI